MTTMSQQDCHHCLVEMDNCGSTGIFNCVRCGARIVGTAEDVVKYRILSNRVLLMAGFFPFFADVAAFLFFVSHMAQGNRLVLAVPLAVMSLVLCWQVVMAYRLKRGWFAWLMAVLYAITLIVALIRIF
jgi:hypothetical protein